MKSLNEIRLAIIGLGYVGLPLAVEFGKKRPVVGFDIQQQRIDQLRSGHDVTRETEPQVLMICATAIVLLSRCRLRSINISAPT